MNINEEPFSNQCNDTFDCVFGDVRKICYEENDFRSEVFFCDCSNWLGWNGFDCTETTPALNWLRLLSFLFLPWSFFILFVTSKTLYLSLQHKRTNKIRISKVNPVLWVTVFVWIASFFLIIPGLLRLPSYYNPKVFKTILEKSVVFGDEIEVVRNVSEAVDVTLFIASILQILASITIIASWLDLFSRLTKIFPDSEKYISERTLKRSIAGVNIFIIIVSIILVLAQFYNELVLFYIFAAITVIIGYIVGYCRFKDQMSSFAKTDTLKGNESQKKSVLLVKRSYQVNVFCNFGILFFSFVYAYGITNHERVNEIGGFNFFQPFLDLAIFLGYSITTYTAYYCHVVNSKLLKRTHKIHWVPFMDWYKIKMNIDPMTILEPSEQARRKSQFTSEDIKSEDL